MENPRLFWIYPIIIFFLLFAPNLLREGMFVDGVWYAAISNNLAHDIGGFWAPLFTKTIYPIFYEHPPLAFWIQSMFFDLFGEHFFVERLYCFLVFLVSAWLIILIWREVFSEKPEYTSLSFLPIIFWMLNTGIFFAYPNNVLECTMTVFLMTSIYLLIKSTLSNNRLGYFLIILAGIFVALGFLTKGFVALFPLIFFLLYQPVFKTNITQNLVRSMVLVGSFSLIIIIIFQSPDARIFFYNYLDNQVIAALKGQRIENLRENRFFLLIWLLNSFVIVGVVCLFLIASYYWFKKKSSTMIVKSPEVKKWGIFFILIGLSASLPLLISLKQAGYYLVPSIALFSIAISVLMAPITSKLISSLRSSKYHRWGLISTLILLFVSIVLALSNIGTVDKRDRDRIALVKEVSKVVPRGVVLSSNTESFDHSLHGFFQRYHMVALDTVRKNLWKHNYILSDRKMDSISDEYNEKQISGIYFYQKKPSYEIK